MEQYFGKISIGLTENTGGSGSEAVKTMFVHYPDCQQLIIWLPEYGYNYGAMRLIDTHAQQTVLEHPVADKLNGSIQLLWGTLGIAPGEYRIEIDHPGGWQHRIAFVKYPENIEPPEIPETAEPKEEKREGPIVYRDGFGNVIPDEDLILRDKVINDVANKFSRRIEY